MERVCNHPQGLYLGPSPRCAICGEKNLMHSDFISYRSDCPLCRGAGKVGSDDPVLAHYGVPKRPCPECDGGRAVVAVRAVHSGHGVVSMGTMGKGRNPDEARVALLRAITTAHCTRCGALLAFDDHEGNCPIRLGLDEASDPALQRLDDTQ